MPSDIGFVTTKKYKAFWIISPAQLFIPEAFYSYEFTGRNKRKTSFSITRISVYAASAGTCDYFTQQGMLERGDGTSCGIARSAARSSFSIFVFVCLRMFRFFGLHTCHSSLSQNGKKWLANEIGLVSE